MDLCKTILTLLAPGVAAARKSFHAASGRFLADNGGWAVTNQDVIFPLALLYTQEGTPCRDDAALLELALRGGDALRDAQDEKGQWEFVKPDGSTWGKTYMCWSMYHWLEAFGLLRERMDAQRRQNWEEGLHLAFDGSSRELKERGRVHNIPAWHAMALVRADQLLGNPAWRQVGQEMLARVVAAQDQEGYWPEGGGPTTAYNTVYVHALGLYYWFTRDERVLPALERATQFHLNFTWPDGSNVETIDGRVRHHRTLPWMGHPGFATSPAGRGFVRFLLDRMIENDKGGGSQSRYFAIGKPGLSGALAATCLHVPPEGPEAQIPQEQPQFAANFHGRALLRRQDGWMSCLSGYVNTEQDWLTNFPNRWITDRQNFLSLWHEQSGLLVGGGNSKHQPELSSFAILAGRACKYVPDQAELRSESACDSSPQSRSTAIGRSILTLTYGSVVCELSVQVLGESEAQISFRVVSCGQSVQGVGAIRAAITLPYLDGKPFCAPRRAGSVQLSAKAEFGHSVAADAPEDARWLSVGPLRLELPPDSNFAYPVYPFNPYAIDGASTPESAVGVVSTVLDPAGQAKMIRLRIV